MISFTMARQANKAGTDLSFPVRGSLTVGGQTAVKLICRGLESSSQTGAETGFLKVGVLVTVDY